MEQGRDRAKFFSAVGYLDSAGRVWLPDTPRTSLERDGHRRGRSLRTAGLRIAQLLADDPRRRWTERDLANRAGTSTSTAHKPVLTGPPRTLLRVETPAGTDLNDIPSMLGGVRDEAGANAVLIDDRDGLGRREAQRSSAGALVAPPSRVMLDLWLEPRGHAAVDAFLELWNQIGHDAAASP